MDSRHRIYGSRKIVRLITVLALLSLGVWASSPASAATSRGHAHATMTNMHIAFSTWTGYGPLVVGVKKGIFRQNGVNVSYTVVEDASAREAAIKANRLDGAATTIDTFTRWAAQATPIQMILGIDRSAGGDGIVAKKGITSVKQLKGKTVAVATGTVSEFFFDYVLQQNGMSIKDVNLKIMPDSSVAGSTFVANKVDAAVTWEPWLTRAASTSFGHILVSSAKYPNIIVDGLGLRSDYIKAHTAAVRNFVRAYYQAVNYTEFHPADANKIIGSYVNETPQGVKSDFTKVPLMNLSIARKYFGTPQSPGPAFKVARFAGNFWIRLKIINKMPNLNKLINPAFLEGM